MSPDLPLRERFWRDVATAAGHNNSDPRAIREAVEDMMRNYHLLEVPGFETTSVDDPPNVPDTNDFSKHSAFAPVFSRDTSTAPSSWSCFNIARPIFFGPRRRKSRQEQRQPDHFPDHGGNPGIQAGADQPAPQATIEPKVDGALPWWYSPQLPPWTPHYYVWAFPTGHLAWTPHPQPTPSVPYPLTPWAAVSLTGGHPLPGTMPQWTPGTWPPLDWDSARSVPIRLSPHVIPNPNNAHLPLIDWNVIRHPSTAKRLTPNHVVVDMQSIWAQAVTHTNAPTIVLTCDVGHMSTLWGPIVVERGDASVTVRDLFDAVYAYFQVPLTLPEVRYVCDLHSSNYLRLRDAYYARCRESTALPGWEARQGFRRADVLGDRKYWWGVWVSTSRPEAPEARWWLNLGLMNRGTAE